MKKTLLGFITVSLFACSGSAQIKKGSIFLGGDISGSTQKTKAGDVTTNKQNGINISPVFGKAIKDNLVLGVNAGFGIYNSKSIDNNWEQKSGSFNGGLFVRKYKNLASSGFYLFLQGGLGVSYYKQKLETSSPLNFDETKRVNAGINIYPGLSYAVTKKLHLETGFINLLSLNYFNEKRENNNPGTSYKSNGFSISSSLSNATSNLFIGIRLLIGK